MTDQRCSARRVDRSYGMNAQCELTEAHDDLHQATIGHGHVERWAGRILDSTPAGWQSPVQKQSPPRPVSYSSTLILELIQEIALQGGTVDISGDSVVGAGQGVAVAVAVTVPGSSPGILSRFAGFSPSADKRGSVPSAADALSRALQAYELSRATALVFGDQVITAWIRCQEGPTEGAARAQADGKPGRRQRVREALASVAEGNPSFRPEQILVAVRGLVMGWEP